MNALFTFIVVVQVLAALTIIGLVLLQHGKGADMGAAFGSGASGSLFGASGSSNFLSKSTGVAAAIFFGATLALAFIGNRHEAVSGGVMEGLPVVPSSNQGAPVNSAAPNEASKAAVVRPEKSDADKAANQSSQIPK
jgi:preprotein translocase subunit SecG